MLESRQTIYEATYATHITLILMLLEFLSEFEESQICVKIEKNPFFISSTK